MSPTKTMSIILRGKTLIQKCLLINVFSFQCFPLYGIHLWVMLLTAYRYIQNKNGIAVSEKQQSFINNTLASAILTTAGHLAKLSGSLSIDDNGIPSCMGHSSISLLGYHCCCHCLPRQCGGH